MHGITEPRVAADGRNVNADNIAESGKKTGSLPDRGRGRGMVAITVALFSLVLAIYVDDQFYTNRGPGFPITLIPFYDLGVALAPFGSPSAALSQSGIDNPTVLTFSLTLANAFIVSATIAITFMIMVRLGYRIPLSAVAAPLLAFGTTFWSYASKSLFASFPIASRAWARQHIEPTMAPRQRPWSS